MASPAELIKIDEQREAQKRAAAADQTMRRPPDGSIAWEGRRMAVWLPAGETPFTLKLETFKRRPT